MLRSISALFFRSLRADSRSVWVHASWLLFLIVIYVAMGFAQYRSQFFGAPGLQFFQSVVYTNAVFVTLLGISYFSSAISEEKEEDTLGLMTMAGIDPLGILLGKSTTRLFQVFVLLAVQYPFTLLAITMGGLMPPQIYAAYAALLAYTILLANVGLLCSVVCRRNRDASGLTVLWTIGYCFVPMLAYAGYYYLNYGNGAQNPRWYRFVPVLSPVLNWASQTSVFGELYRVTSTGYQFSLTPQLISNSIGGLAFFLLSWWLFGIVSQDPAPEVTTRALVPRKIGYLQWFSAGRTWDAALIWKDFHFFAGGWFGLLIRIGLYTGYYWIVCAATYPWYEERKTRHINWNDVTLGYQYFVVPLFVIDCVLCLSRVFQEEIRHQTLPSLLMLPRSVPNLVYSKIAGCLFGLLPGIVAVFSAFVLLIGATRTLEDQYDEPAAWWLVANLILFIHLSAMLSTYLRWGAIAMSLAFTSGSMIVTGITIEMMRLPYPRNNEMLGLMAIPIVGACVACHLIVLLRLPAIGEK